MLHLASALSLMHNGIKHPLDKQKQLPGWDTIVHLDVKLENVFISQKRAKGHEDDEYPTIVLGDFGCAVRKSDIDEGRIEPLGQPFGTPGWDPPEFDRRPGAVKKAFGRPTDIYLLGEVLHCMCRLLLLPDKQKMGKSPCGTNYSLHLNKLVMFCLNEDPLTRPTAVDLVEKMREWKKLPEEAKVSGESGA